MSVPYFLVASPTMLDSSFSGTVVLMLSHDHTGAHGLVINRPLNLTVKEVAENLDLDGESGDDLAVLWGGPVDGTTGFVVVQNPWMEQEEEDLKALDESIGVGVSKTTLQRAMRRKESKYLLCLGYAGWAPQQLEAEMQEGSWIEVDMDPELIFQTPLDERWMDAIKSLGIDNPAYLSTKPIDE